LFENRAGNVAAQTMIVNLSGRGDKDVNQVQEMLKTQKLPRKLSERRENNDKSN
jgi:hypothetical protein